MLVTVLGRTIDVREGRHASRELISQDAFSNVKEERDEDLGKCDIDARRVTIERCAEESFSTRFPTRTTACVQMAENPQAETHLLRLAGTRLDPLLGLLPALVQAEETGLAAALDELIGLGDELGGENPAGQLRVGCDGVCRRVPGDLRNLGRGVDEVGGDRRVFVDGRGALEPVGQQQLGVVLPNGCCRSSAHQRDRRRYQRCESHLWRT
jgi:hypothetical protein